MTIRFLLNVGGAINAKKGDIRILPEKQAREYISYMIAEEWYQPIRPKHKPIIVHTRCIPKLKSRQQQQPSL